jgi:hypothetical protein
VAATKVEAFGWPRAVSRQLSVLSIGTFVFLCDFFAKSKEVTEEESIIRFGAFYAFSALIECGSC